MKTKHEIQYIYYPTIFQCHSHGPKTRFLQIIFLTISIDPKNARSKWLKTIEQNNMTGLLNLIPENEKGLHFETTYHVVGVPRYFIIDQEGKIVTVFAPGPGKRMKELIQTLLK